MDNSPVLSIVMPSLNVGKYYRKCIESVMNQTLDNIEIICVDAGSTDGTLEILLECASKDSRITVIHSDVKSYGYQMNLGIDHAMGEYIGIVETDDWVDQDMFESLYSMAKKNDVDFVRSNYYWYWTKENKSQLFRNLRKCPCNQVIRPIESRELLFSTPAIWSAIYRRSMLTEKGIRFNETAGASFQDASFFFMVCTVAESAYLTEKAFLHYRKDNDASSVFAAQKVFCIQEEMNYYEDFLERYPQQKKQIMKYYAALKYEKYRWNFERLNAPEQQQFFCVMYQEFSDAKKSGYLSENEFDPDTWKKIQLLLEKPVRYYSRYCKRYSERKEVFRYFSPAVDQYSEIADPDVSVIIPVYNGERYLAEALKSVLENAFDKFEIVAVNDGSSDATAEILTQFAKADRKHFTLLSQTNKGLASARNTALAYAKGKYVLFLDGDDMLEKNAICTLCKTAADRDLDILYYNGRSIYENKQLERKNPFYHTAYQYSGELPSVMSGASLFCKLKKEKGYFDSACLALYRRAFLEEKEIGFVEGVIHEDNLFTMKCMVLAERVSHINDQFLIRRIHDDSTMTMKKDFGHFYGYLLTILNEQQFINDFPYNEEIYKYVVEEIRSKTILLKKTYRQLPNRFAAMDRLNPVERFNAELLLQSTFSQRKHTLIRYYKDHGMKRTVHKVIKRLRM